MSNKLWKKSVSKESLLAGWHLAREELRSAFFFDYFHQQTFASTLDKQVSELERMLKSSTYRTRPLRHVSSPKGPLGTRPGSHIPTRDRVVFWSIVKNIAPIINNSLSDDVYSYRLKKKPSKTNIFEEGDALSVPFMKGVTIRDELDPFDPWYSVWPDFEARSFEEIGLGYDHMVVSDIAAYFENINIDVLRDQLMAGLENEPVLCNFISESLAEWANTSQYGSRPRRGIPQGTGICSFFGNIYLRPIDEAFVELKKSGGDIVYIRYMDDIRIFTKNLPDARKCAFLLEKEVRKLHLNLQTAKTAILIEKSTDPQITNSLVDDRVDALSSLRKTVSEGKIDEGEVNRRLDKIAARSPQNQDQKILKSARYPVPALTDRAIRMWMNQSIFSNNPNYIKLLLRNYPLNPDTRFSKLFVNTCRTFPRYKTIGNSAVNFLNSDLNIHEAHEAEILRGCRYLSTIPIDVYNRAHSNISTFDRDFQVRVQSLILLGNREHSKKTLKKFFA